MEELLEYIKGNYLFFVIVTVVLVLALIGYFVDAKSSKDIKINSSKKHNSVNTMDDEIDTI